MLKSFLRRLLGGSRPTLEMLAQLREEASLDASTRDLRAAVDACRRYLMHRPDDAEVQNNLGCYLFDLGEEEEAIRCFDAAYSLDHNFLPAVINHARTFITMKRAEEGIESLQRAKAASIDGPNIAAIYSSLALLKGRTAHSLQLGRDAWLGLFDNLRAANAHLFTSAYAGIAGRILASEHRFWAATLSPWRSEDRAFEASRESLEHYALPEKGSRVRIAYWSPDLRKHSVGLFALPIFRHHDKSRFEVIVYYDFFRRDAVSSQIAELCDHFIPVCEMSDHTLVELMRSHDLDVLVECAGHTSANRLNLLQHRYARLQISALGYPPTTGLSTIDAKLLDVHIADENVAEFYTEAPMVMSQSFWCFELPEESTIAPQPPFEKNGYITFACVGNIAKIHQPMLNAWRLILEQVGDARLLIRSISFADSSALKSFDQDCRLAGLDMNRVSLLGPEGGVNYYASYNEIDIVLDTYPFNGGTTTCFATYMGVPVVSLQGDSLISRMGKSILTNLDLADWVVSSYDEYVDRAVKAAGDAAFLRLFRAEARDRYRRTALGNGELFTREFEQKCLDWLAQPPVYSHRVAALPEAELVARAYRVFRHGQFEAGQRIVDHILKEYPQCGTAHVLWTQRWTSQGQFSRAAAYLREHAPEFGESHLFNVWLNVARFHLCADELSDACEAIAASRLAPRIKHTDEHQQALLEAWEVVHRQRGISETTEIIVGSPVPDERKTLLIWVGDDFAGFAAMREALLGGSLPVHRLEFEQCAEARRMNCYLRALNNSEFENIVIIQKPVGVLSPLALTELLAALETYDIVGLGGSRTWNRIAWRHSAFIDKAGCQIIPSGERDGWFEINCSGAERRRLSGDFAVLEGAVLAIRRDRLAGRDGLELESLFDPELEGGGLHLEEFFTYQAYRAGAQLGVHLNPGVIYDWRIPVFSENLGDASWQIAKRLEIDPLDNDEGDRAMVSVPVKDAATACRVLDAYLQS